MQLSLVAGKVTINTVMLAMFIYTHLSDRHPARMYYLSQLIINLRTGK
ncbi:hypothetical protein [Nostoc sp.]